MSTTTHAALQRRPALAVATAVLVASASAGAEEWFVVCDTATNAVVVTLQADGPGQLTMMGPLPSRRPADMWVGESCPGRYCDDWGQCAEPPPPPMAASGGWLAGEVTSETLSGPAGGGSTPSGTSGPTGPAGPTGPRGPGGSGLAPLIDNAKAAVEACNFHAALMTAEHMLNFDPDHPWLAANHQRLRDLALRQRATEDAVWQASSYLSSGDLKRARKIASAAADTAVSCQSRAVSDLVRGIDAAIEHERQMRSANNRAAMAALLPTLVDMANTLSGQYHGTAPPSSSGSYGGLSSFGYTPSSPSASPPDPCAFKYEYRSAWSVEPVCTCPGYRWQGAQHRCARGP